MKRQKNLSQEFAELHREVVLLRKDNSRLSGELAQESVEANRFEIEIKRLLSEIERLKAEKEELQASRLREAKRTETAEAVKEGVLETIKTAAEAFGKGVCKNLAGR